MNWKLVGDYLVYLAIRVFVAVVQAMRLETCQHVAGGLATLATLYPAWRAARTQPAEALRYE